MRIVRVLLSAGLASGALVAVSAPAHADPQSDVTRPAGTYVAVRPFRAADTRTKGGPVGAGKVRTVQIGGHGGVPTSSVAAVAITLTAVTPTAGGGLVGYAHGLAVPGTKNLLYTAGHNTAQAAIARVSSGGAIDVANVATSGHTQIVVDVSGYYVGGTASSTQPGVFHALTKPTRVLDTRTSHALAAHSTMNVTLGYRGGLPKAGIGSLALAVSDVSPSQPGALTVYALGNDRPLATTTPFLAHQNVTSFAAVPTTASGAVTIYNSSSAAVQVVIDAMGWTIAGVSQSQGTLQPRFPYRRVNGTTIGANKSAVVAVAGYGGLPAEAPAAAVLGLSVSSPTQVGGLTAWSGTGAMPRVTDLQFTAGRSAASVEIVPVSGGGSVTIHNLSSGTLRLWVDLLGFIASDTITAPTTSISRYVRNITGTNSSVMGGEGCHDAKTASTLILLEFGVQTKTSLPSPGVLLTQTSTRLTYAQLESAIQTYVSAFFDCDTSGRDVTIALGTNNGGVYSGTNAYPAPQRGTDWAGVVADLRGNAPTRLTIVGANDIEAGFDSSTDAEKHASDWEDAYLAVDNTDDEVGALIFNGSLDNCPDAFGTTTTSCSPGWTQAEYYNLAFGKNTDRLRALPQVYTISQATQWTNVVASGFGGMQFAGALTEFAACPATSAACPTASLTPANGWSALVRGLQTLSVDLPDIPAVTDLQVDS